MGGRSSYMLKHYSSNMKFVTIVQLVSDELYWIHLHMLGVATCRTDQDEALSCLALRVLQVQYI